VLDLSPKTKYVLVTNLSRSKAIINKGQKVSNLEVLNDAKVTLPSVHQEKNDIDDLLKIFEGPAEYKEQFKAEIQIALNATITPEKLAIEHEINLMENTKPIQQRPYRNNLRDKKEINAQVSTLLEKKYISASQSSYSSPVVLVEKKDGSKRFCVDY
jgi:septum formation inhibitor MinC